MGTSWITRKGGILEIVEGDLKNGGMTPPPPLPTMGYTYCRTKEIYKTYESSLRKIEKILVAGHFDDLITMNSKHSFCCDNISQITLLLSKLGFRYTPREINVQSLPGN